MSYGAKTINEMYGMEGQRHGSKYKKIVDNPNREKIARKLTFRTLVPPILFSSAH